MGSVKDLKVIREPTEDKPGIGHFTFSDRYSVFDWGAMPDEIPNKGSSLAIMTTHFFELLQKRGINTHYRGIVSGSDILELDNVEKPFDTIEVNLLRVIKPESSNGGYDYTIYKEIDKNYLIPMEFIYRNSIPSGSSFWKRYNNGNLKINVPENIEPDKELGIPIFDVSTKLEETDRYISWNEAMEMAHLEEVHIGEVKGLLSRIDRIISDEVNRCGLVNQDGKLEFGMDEHGFIVVVDALGTLDECRFLHEGMALSKEILRKFYRKTDWYRMVKTAKEEDYKNWKMLIDSEPPPLPEDLKNTVSQIYQSFANSISNIEFFKVPPLEDNLKNIVKYIDLS